MSDQVKKQYEKPEPKFYVRDIPICGNLIL